MALIQARELTKTFKVPEKDPGFLGAIKHLFRPRYTRKTAVDRISFSIEAAESVAVVGPNGAGKSTTLKMLTGILPPSAGNLTVMGVDPHRCRRENAARIGVVFGQRSQLWWDLPVQDSFRLLGDIYNVPAATFQRNLGEFTELLELAPLLRRPVRQLSLGQKMRCDLAAALLHNPPIVYLDEPTIGLDIAVKERIRSFIKRRNREDGVTLVLTSHDLGDIEDLCTRIIMINHGNILFDGPLSTIRQRFCQTRKLELLLDDDAAVAVNTMQAVLPELPASAMLQANPRQISISFDPATLPLAVLMGRLLPLLPIKDLRIDEPSIESVIHAFYRGQLALQEAA